MTTFCVTVLCTATRFSGDKGEACRYDLSAIGGERPRHISVSVFHVQILRRQDRLVRGYTKRQTKIYIYIYIFASVSRAGPKTTGTYVAVRGERARHIPVSVFHVQVERRQR